MKIKNKNRGMLSRLVAVAAIALCCVMALPTVVHAEDVPENKNEFHIKNEADFLSCVALSRERDTSGWYVYLDNDIELDSDDMKAIVANTVKHLSFGNKEHPFKGVFDGQNHTVEGLSYDKDAFDPERDTGFFAETNGATIKNFLVKDANVWADFRGGIIVGKAVKTRFENVMVMESTLHVTCANNALNLITNAGFEGGLIAGELDGCTLYNCEVRGGRAVNNTTSGVQALGGEGLYMAAFAGYVTNSTIEYCRVTPTRKKDGSIAANGMTDVTNKYDVAVGALGGNNVYASGFVGCMAGNAKIIDCFSTAQCYSYAASYVGVVSVTRAWTGGLAGRILTAEGNELVRSHFAGDLSSRQYNPIAVIPIIQNDVNLGGIAARANKGDATVTECYFKPSVSLNGSSQGTAAEKKIPSFGGDGTTKGDGYGPWDDGRYATRELWEEHDYDFCAGTMRSTANDEALGGSHANEWAMDYRLNIPVHGQSVKATIDFPGAGTATIEATKLGIDQKTSDPYAFAVSAVLAGTAQGLAQGDTSVTFRQETSAKPAGLSEANGGYRFMGWFHESGVNVNRIDADNAWFNGKTDAAAVAADKRVEENTDHDKASTYTANNGSGVDEKFGFKGNDLFIASYEAQVLFYNVKGKTLDWKTGAAHDKSTDWYRYGVGLTPAAPEDREGLSATATFIGWTTQPSSDEGMNGAYAAITSDKLAELKNQGAFYPAGSEITVVRPADFYPVYSDYVSNIITVFEGNEQDALNDVSQRVGVGKTKVDVKTAGGGTSVYTVQVCNTDGTPLSDGGKLPDGYRFLGWYENKGTEDAPLEVRVSRDPSYTLPADVDLTVPHTYIARFEYRVDYYVKSMTNDAYKDSRLLCSVWNGYQTSFNEQVGSSYVRENIVHWGSEHVYHGLKENYKDECNEGRFGAETLIVAPLKAYSHTVKNDTGVDTRKNVIADTDFPGSGTLDDEWVAGALKFYFRPASKRYHLNFWTLERQGGCWTCVGNPVQSEIGIDSEYYMRAMVTTSVSFYGKDDVSVKSVTRRYEAPLLLDSDSTYTYKYPFIHTEQTVANTPEHGKEGDVNPNLTLEASPTDAEMAVPGYKFLGWISTAEVQRDSDVWKYIYDVEGDSFTTSDPDKAEPYLVKPDFKVTQWQDAYPVYAKYDVRYTTNLYRAGFKGTDKVNVPRCDIDPVINAGTDPATATVTPDVTTPVYKAGGELYKLQKVEIELPNGEVEDIEPNGDNSYSHQVEPGGAYTFVAYYSPLAVVYHLNARDVDGKVAQQGDSLGSLKDGIPLPTYDVGDIDATTNAYNAFVGWTETKPVAGNGYVVWSDDVSMVNKSTVVKAPMELYPVYRASAVRVQSNIDANLDDPGSVRYLSRTDSGDQISLEVKAATEVVGKDGTKYDFVGWSRDYESDNKYTLMTGDDKYPLEGNEPFKSAMYTAVYKIAPHKVRYHGVDGSVLFTATVDSGDERAQDGKSGFVYTVDVPKMDENGRPVYDNSGNPMMEQKSVAYDPDAHSKIVALLDERAAANGDMRELFLEWRYVGADGDTKPWDVFKDEPIKGDMDLYPVTYRVVAKDTSDPAKSETMTAQLKWLLDPAAANTVDDSADKAPFKVCFAKPFMGTRLTVTVMRASYGPGTEGVSVAEEPVNGKFVSLYSLGSDDGSFDLANRLESKKTGEGDQGPGKAVFNFAQTHALTIVKKTTDASAMGQTFRFKVTRKMSQDSPAETRMVEVKVSEQRDENGETCYVGSVQFAAPAGIYTVEEDTAWAWRYQGELSTPGKAPGKTAELTISSASSANDATFTCTNTRVNDKWIDGSDRAHNVWSNGNVAKKED
jgi:hypothetical protein